MRVLLIALLLPLAAATLEAQEKLLRGRITTESGDAIASATVVLELTDMRVRRQVQVVRTETDPRGEYQIDLSPWDFPTYGLQVNAMTDFHVESLMIKVVPREELPVTLDFELPAASVLEGRLLDETGAPIAGGTISVPSARPVTTDQQGKFRVVGAPCGDTVTLTASMDGYAAGELTEENLSSRVVSGLEIRLMRSRKFFGRLLLPDEKPVEGGRIVLHVGTSQYLTTEVKEEGRFEFGHIPPTDGAELSLSLMHPEHLLRKHPIGTTITEEELLVRVPWAIRLAGKVLLPSGEPAAGAMVQFGDGVTELVEPTTCDMLGEWLGPPMAVGGLATVTASPPAAGSKSSVGELVISRGKGSVDPWPAGHRSSFTVEVSGSTIRMTRRDEGAGGMPGDVLYEGTLSGDGRMMEGTLRVPAINAKGRFRARAYGGQSVDGDWDLREELDPVRGLAPVQQLVSLAPFSGIQRLTLALGKPLTIQGRVTDAEGKPATLGRVLVSRWNGTTLFRSETPIQNGLFAASDLPFGFVELKAVGPDDRPLAQPRFVSTESSFVELKGAASNEATTDPLSP
jgi:hypothetical protein